MLKCTVVAGFESGFLIIALCTGDLISKHCASVLLIDSSMILHDGALSCVLALHLSLTECSKSAEDLIFGSVL